MNSKRKGNRGELNLLHLLHQQGFTAWRGNQRYVGGLENPDVGLAVGGTTYHLEVKRQERLCVPTAYRQAVRDANGKAVPCVVHRRNHEPWLVSISLDDFLTLLNGT